MKTQWLSMGLATALLMVGSGCTVKCKFEREVRDRSKIGHHTEYCRGSIVSCIIPTENCKNVLKIECDDDLIYRGPYTVSMKGNSLKYTASRWRGSDAPFIKTEIPKENFEVVWAKFVDDEKESEGSCKYGSKEE